MFYFYFSDDKLALRDEIVQLRVSIGEKDEEICRLKGKSRDTAQNHELRGFDSNKHVLF